MTNLEEMTKKDLLALAKEHEITGRHDMSKEDLVEALADYIDDEDEETEEDAPEVANSDTLVELKRRRPSPRERDANGKVIRRERNLSGNVPFAHKMYALSTAFANEKRWTADYRAAVSAAPMQVQLILKAMRELDITGDNGHRGSEIVETALAHGYLSTKIEPSALFAYYRRLLEALGVVHLEDYE